MDIRMVRVSGLEALEEIRRFNPALPVILMTAYASVETAVEALKKGAYDYLTKPLDFDELRLAMERALEHTHLKEENRVLRESLGARFDRGNLIGRSAAMTKLLDLVAQVAPSEATVLVTGESGTGKEMIAWAIHTNSPRKARSLHPHQLRRHHGDAAGIGALRPRERLLHRRRPAQGRQIQAGRQGDDFS